MEYVLELLQSALRDELRAYGAATAYLEGCPRSGRKTEPGSSYYGATHAAFSDSLELAKERIPQLNCAILAVHAHEKAQKKANKKELKNFKL